MGTWVATRQNLSHRNRWQLEVGRAIQLCFCDTRGHAVNTQTWRTFWSFLALAGSLFLSPSSCPLWDCGACWKVQDAGECQISSSWDFRVQSFIQREQESPWWEWASEVLGEVRCRQRNWVYYTLCTSTKVLSKSWCLGLCSIFWRSKFTR